MTSKDGYGRNTMSKYKEMLPGNNYDLSFTGLDANVPYAISFFATNGAVPGYIYQTNVNTVKGRTTNWQVLESSVLSFNLLICIVLSVFITV